MERYDETTPDERAIGAMFKRAAKIGMCVQTDRFVNSRHKRNHACPWRVWRSLLIRPDFILSKSKILPSDLDEMDFAG